MAQSDLNPHFENWHYFFYFLNWVGIIQSSTHLEYKLILLGFFQDNLNILTLMFVLLCILLTSYFYVFHDHSIFFISFNTMSLRYKTLQLPWTKEISKFIIRCSCYTIEFTNTDEALIQYVRWFKIIFINIS